MENKNPILKFYAYRKMIRLIKNKEGKELDNFDKKAI